MHKSVPFADFFCSIMLPSAHTVSENSLKSPATLDLGASSSVPGTSKHLSTQTVPLGQSLGYSQREEWKIIQHGWLNMETRQERRATPESHGQSTRMTLSAEDELPGELIKERSEGCCKVPAEQGTPELVSLGARQPSQGLRLGQPEKLFSPAANRYSLQPGKGVHAALLNSIVFPRESQSWAQLLAEGCTISQLCCWQALCTLGKAKAQESP